MILSRSTLPDVDDHTRRVINGTLYYLTLQPRLFPPRRHAMNASRELGSAPIYDSYSPTYDSSHGPQEGERDAPRTLVTLHL